MLADRYFEKLRIWSRLVRNNFYKMVLVFFWIKSAKNWIFSSVWLYQNNNKEYTPLPLHQINALALTPQDCQGSECLWSEPPDRLGQSYFNPFTPELLHRCQTPQSHWVQLLGWGQGGTGSSGVPLYGTFFVGNKSRQKILFIWHAYRPILKPFIITNPWVQSLLVI